MILRIKEVFKIALKNRWSSLRSSSLSNSTILNTIDSYTENLKSNNITNQNFYVWPVLGQYIWPNFFVGSTHEEEIEFLKNLLMNKEQDKDK